jgi:hypothetical protein
MSQQQQQDKSMIQHRRFDLKVLQCRQFPIAEIFCNTVVNLRSTTLNFSVARILMQRKLACKVVKLGKVVGGKRSTHAAL